jgi:outer membrane receptor protein involved in Fe transport
LRTTGGRGDEITTPSFGVAKLSTTYSRDAWSVSFYANNLFDEYIETAVLGGPLNDQTVTDINGDPVSLRSIRSTLGAPRTLGVRFKVNID